MSYEQERLELERRRKHKKMQETGRIILRFSLCALALALAGAFSINYFCFVTIPVATLAMLFLCFAAHSLPLRIKHKRLFAVSAGIAVFAIFFALSLPLRSALFGL